ncbi:DUF922 domain-containing protein [Anditalea andensis]|uniref:DUF922 domain-containing protein n=1 Tax=Anditalea andensis TaxID=1048983 RepID=A0A074KZX9_9BACT|nr:hypothetical protein [Anditalea andensis]KEO74489.1 hypothetical protein EL17_07050 [Anditalea andensis]
MTTKTIYRYIVYILFFTAAVLGGFWLYYLNSSSLSISPDRKLQWRDFKLVEKINNRPRINARCITFIEPTIRNIKQKNGYAKIIVALEVGIDKELTQVSGSFMARADQPTKNAVLNHENGHYKIAQIMGYRILEQVKSYRFHPSSHQAEFDSLIRSQFLEWRKMDQQYDLETTNPRNYEKQEEWDMFFRTELNRH